VPRDHNARASLLLFADAAVMPWRSAELRSAGQPRAAVPTFSC